MLEAARAVYHRPKDPPERAKERTQELERLRTSSSVIDRYAARLVARWDAADRLTR